MQPALVSLLTHAVVHNPKSGFDKNGDPVLFYRAGEFPSASDPEFEVASEARIVYKTGELPVVLKSLAPKAYSMGVPFSYLSFVNTHWTTLIGMLGMLALMLPLTRAVPALYVWTVRRRLVYWYRQLKALERNLDSGAAKYDPGVLQAEFDRIDSHVRRVACAELLLQRALRLARAHRSCAPANGDEARETQDGGGVAALPIAPSCVGNNHSVSFVLA